MKKSYHSKTVPADEAVNTSAIFLRSVGACGSLSMRLHLKAGRDWVSDAGLRQAAAPGAIGEIENQAHRVPQHKPDLREMRQPNEKEEQTSDDADRAHEPGRLHPENPGPLRLADSQHEHANGNGDKRAQGAG